MGAGSGAAGGARGSTGGGSLAVCGAGSAAGRAARSLSAAAARSPSAGDSPCRMLAPGGGGGVSWALADSVRCFTHALIWSGGTPALSACAVTTFSAAARISGGA